MQEFVKNASSIKDMKLNILRIYVHVYEYVQNVCVV